MLGPPDLLEQPLPPNGHEVIPTFDLRRALTRMQLDRSSDPRPNGTCLSMGEGNDIAGGAVDVQASDAEFKVAVQALSYRSFIDACIESRPEDLIEVSSAILCSLKHIEQNKERTADNVDYRDRSVRFEYRRSAQRQSSGQGALCRPTPDPRVDRPSAELRHGRSAV